MKARIKEIVSNDNNGTVNILSIDWDYFFLTTKYERRILVARGNENWAPNITESMWAAKYAEWFGFIEKTKTDKDAINKIENVIWNTQWKKVMIANSHKHCYKFVNDCAKDKPFNICNIDYHHDIYTSDKEEEIDCQNWLFKLHENNENLQSATWIKREDSEDYYDPEYPEDTKYHLNTTTDLNYINSISWDYLFICRSPLWSFPHLDNEFTNVFKTIINKGYPTEYEKSVFESRWNKEFFEEIESMKEQYKEQYILNGHYDKSKNSTLKKLKEERKY